MFYHVCARLCSNWFSVLDNHTREVLFITPIFQMRKVRHKESARWAVEPALRPRGLAPELPSQLSSSVLLRWSRQAPPGQKLFSLFTWSQREHSFLDLGPTKICNLICCWTLEWPLYFALIYKTFLVFICFIVRDVVSLISPLSVWITCLVHVAKIIYKEAAIC